MEGYSVKIREVSKEITAKERVMLKDTTNAISLDEVTQGAKFVFEPSHYAILDVHNDKSDDKDYTKYIIVDKRGAKLVTGSESFFTSLSPLWMKWKAVTRSSALRHIGCPVRTIRARNS